MLYQLKFSTHLRYVPTLMTKFTRRAASIAALSMAVASGATAQSIASDVGASERINLAGQLGTLSQRIIASACNLNSGVSVRESQAVLQISADQFGRISDALLYGNRGFGILGEDRACAPCRSSTASTLHGAR